MKVIGKSMGLGASSDVPMWISGPVIFWVLMDCNQDQQDVSKNNSTGSKMCTYVPLKKYFFKCRRGQKRESGWRIIGALYIIISLNKRKDLSLD